MTDSYQLPWYPIARQHFPDVPSYADFVERSLADGSGYAADGYGQSAIRNGIRMLRDGDTSMVAEAERVMAELNVNLPSIAPATFYDVAGDYVDVARYLDGEPECMSYQEQVENTSVPIRIWVNVLPSGGVPGSQLLRHGAVISALAMILQQQRSIVRVSPYADLGDDSRRQGAVVSWDLPASPIVVSTLTACLAQPDIVRATTVQANRKLNRRCGYGWLRGHNPTYGYSDSYVRQDLGAGPDDVIVPGLHLHSPHLGNPRAWIEAELSRILNGEVPQ